MRKLLALVLAVCLLGANPSVLTFGAAAATTGGVTTVTLGSNPTTGTSQELVAAIFINAGTAPSMSGTWTQLCTDSGNNKEYIEARAVVSGDTSSPTVTVLSSASVNSNVELYEVNNYTALDGACQFAHASGTNTVFATLTTAVTPNFNADLVLGVGHIYATFSSGGLDPTFTECGSLTADTPNAHAGTGTARSQVNAGHAATVSTTLSCAMQYASGGGASTGGTMETALFAIQGGSPLCANSLMLEGYGC